MTTATTATPFQRRQALTALCVTEIVSWGVLYYTLPVALDDVVADTGWSATAVTAAFSAGLLVSAVAGIPVGRWLDRFGPRPVMTGGSLLAGVATLGIAGAGLALLGAVRGPIWLLVVIAVLVGAIRGASTLLQATVVAELWGSARYGAIAGWFTAPLTAAAALAPWGATALASGLPGGYPAATVTLAALTATAGALAAALLLPQLRNGPKP